MLWIGILGSTLGSYNQIRNKLHRKVLLCSPNHVVNARRGLLCDMSYENRTSRGLLWNHSCENRTCRVSSATFHMRTERAGISSATFRMRIFSFFPHTIHEATVTNTHAHYSHHLFICRIWCARALCFCCKGCNGTIPNTGASGFPYYKRNGAS